MSLFTLPYFWLFANYCKYINSLSLEVKDINETGFENRPYYFLKRKEWKISQNAGGIPSISVEVSNEKCS
ncbi:hypothetical protein LOAG_01197 [Loa loa]|uniref:Uncharacterized protein n=1 Tax=Loa loa TaxID=7209 RepID=A0A1S0UA82_LOALO|nr:hypothetical protein LOAG_01197 [Loa loa]EFO27279.1 hypothetical protein LOAG_01197 [Loa loa]